MNKNKIEALINDMTIEEKLAQITQLAPMFFGVEQDVDLTGPLAEFNIKKEDLKNIGSTLNYFGAKNIIELQKRYMENNRHHIPLLFMADVIYGYKTAFPIPLALSCSFNPENYENAASVSAAESAASGIHLTFAPMSDLVRDPRWGRVMESPGEDPYLNCVMTKAAVSGFQGDDPRAKGKIASCVKHFAGYGACEGGRDYNWVDISENSFRQFYLPSYKAALDAGAKMVMTSFNVIDGIPSSANKKLFRDILRNEWGFNGATISDYAAINETIVNGLSKNEEDAAKKCLEAGVDIEMMSTHYINCGKGLVEEGRLSLWLIDNAVRNVLNLKNDLGLFENPFKDASEEDEKRLHLCSEHRKKALKAARQAIVLLENNGILPLKKGAKVGIAGPFADTECASGGWILTAKKDSASLSDALKQQGFCVVTEMTEPLGSMKEQIFDVEDQTEKAARAFADCDVIIAAVGENPYDTGEASSKAYLRLSPNQEKLIQKMKETKKPVVTIVFSARPMEVKPILTYCDALIQGWFLGTESGNGLADVLSGNYNPSGRLAMSFPETVGQIPVYYNNYRTGRPYHGQTDHYVSKYLDCPNEPLYPFGYGLSYSEVEYSNFSATQEGDKVCAAVTVLNHSDREVLETVQLYIRDVAASVVRPVKELKSFQQIVLKPNKSEKVHFTLTKDMLKFYNKDLEYVFEPGEFEIMVGRNSQDVSTLNLWLDRPSLVEIFESYEQMCQTIAEEICIDLSKNPKQLLCIAAGNTSLGVFERLVHMYKEGKADFSNAYFVSMDEWMGMNENTPGSCGNFLVKHFLRSVNYPTEHVKLWNGNSENPLAECQEAENFLNFGKNRKIDYLVLGCGMNGHLALNEPGADFSLGAHIHELDETTKQVGQKYFEKQAILERGLTLGIKNFADSSRTVLMISGKHKTEITKQILSSNEVTPAIPATAVYSFPNASIYCDQDATCF